MPCPCSGAFCTLPSLQKETLNLAFLQLFAVLRKNCLCPGVLLYSSFLSNRNFKYFIPSIFRCSMDSLSLSWCPFCTLPSRQIGTRKNLPFFNPDMQCVESKVFISSISLLYGSFVLVLVSLLYSSFPPNINLNSFIPSISRCSMDALSLSWCPSVLFLPAK